MKLIFLLCNDLVKTQGIAQFLYKNRHPPFRASDLIYLNVQDKFIKSAIIIDAKSKKTVKITILVTVLPFAAMAPEVTIKEKLLLGGSNQFTARMFSEVVKSKPEQSVILSAISVMSPLAELALASVGDSHDELLAAVGTPDDESTKEVFLYANKFLQSAEGIILKIANKIYIGKNYELNSAFANVSRDVFDSEIQNIDFGENVKTATEINTWVEEKTNHRIKDLVDPESLTGNTRALLVNAIYFQGAWEDPFEKDLTQDKDFFVNKNKVIKVPMMYRSGFYSYLESDELKSQILEIPYNRYRAALIIVLPRDVEGIVELEEKLKDPNVLNNALNNKLGQKVEVYIPRFKIETTTNLKDILIKMNVSKMFKANEAKLHNLLKNSDDLYIDTALQKAFIEVNEEGAEAAAANEFGGVGGAFIFNPEPTPVFNANRPFYFAIKMNILTLFNGVMYGA